MPSRYGRYKRRTRPGARQTRMSRYFRSRKRRFLTAIRRRRTRRRGIRNRNYRFNRQLNPFGDKRVVTHKWVQSFYATVPTSKDLWRRRFNLNCVANPLYPDPIEHQPMYYDQMKTFYHNHAIISVRYSVTFQNINDSATDGHGMLFGVYVDDAEDAFNLDRTGQVVDAPTNPGDSTGGFRGKHVTAQQIMETAGVKYAIRNSPNHGNATWSTGGVIGMKRWHNGRLWSDRSTDVDDADGLPASGHPLRHCRLYLLQTPMYNQNSGQFGVTLRLWYKVLYHNPKDLAQS